MGMYDTITCAATLPGEPPDFAGNNYQTKDLGCDLATYEITADGRLSCVEDGWSGRVSDKFLSTFHGTIDFYTHGPGSAWIEYRAYFSYGKLDRIDEEERIPAGDGATVGQGETE